MKRFLKSSGGWLLSFFLSVWAGVKLALDWVGRSTLSEDWQALMAEKLPLWAAWLFSTPWWVPAILAALLTTWMIWLTWPARSKIEESPKRAQNRIPSDNEERVNEAFSAKDIYIGQVHVDISKMIAESWISYAIEFFNSSSYPIRIGSVTGSIEMRDGNNSWIKIDTPFLSDPSSIAKIEKKKNGMIVLRQVVSRDLSEKISEAVLTEHGVAIDFDTLIVPLYFGDGETYIRFPLCKEIRFKIVPGLPHAFKTVSLSANIVI